MYRFNVPDMTCQHCVMTITKTVKAQDPKAEVDIDLPAHVVKVESSLPAEQFRREIEEAGYTPTLQG
jgi:copper chaperone